jgi:hypothetical protein
VRRGERVGDLGHKQAEESLPMFQLLNILFSRLSASFNIVYNTHGCCHQLLAGACDRNSLH